MLAANSARLSEASTPAHSTLGRDSLGNQIVLYELRSSFAQRPVVFVGAPDVGMTHNHQLVVLIVLLVIFERVRRFRKNLCFAGDQTYDRVIPLGVIGGVKDASERYRRSGVNGTSKVQGSSSSGGASASVGRGERVGHVPMDGPGAGLFGRRFDILSSC